VAGTGKRKKGKNIEGKEEERKGKREGEGTNEHSLWRFPQKGQL
jgi:hypothetical protein